MTRSRCCRRKTASTGRGKQPQDTTGSLAVLGNPLTLPYPGDTPELTELREELRDNPRLAELTARWFAPPPAWLQEAEQSAAEHRTEIHGQLERLLARAARPGPGPPLVGADRPVARTGTPRSITNISSPSIWTCPPRRPARHRAALFAPGCRPPRCTRSRQAPVMTAGQISAVVTFADACEVTALSLLDGPPGLTPERWAGLALVLAFADCDHVDQDPQAACSRTPSPRPGPLFAEALPAALSAVSPPQWIANIIATLVAKPTSVTRSTRPCSPGQPTRVSRPRSGATRCRHWPPTTGPRCRSWPSWPELADRGFPRRRRRRRPAALGAGR